MKMQHCVCVVNPLQSSWQFKICCLPTSTPSPWKKPFLQRDSAFSSFFFSVMYFSCFALQGLVRPLAWLEGVEKSESSKPHWHASLIYFYSTLPFFPQRKTQGEKNSSHGRREPVVEMKRSGSHFQAALPPWFTLPENEYATVVGRGRPPWLRLHPYRSASVT